MSYRDYLKFAKESNMIEGIVNCETRDESHAQALEMFVETCLPDGYGLPSVQVDDLASFVHKIQPGARLRTKPTDEIYIGNHIPPKPPESLSRLNTLLVDLHLKSAYNAHCEYEHIHPFMDGNGRSGRALWLVKMMADGYRPDDHLSFLHMFYYQTLGAYHGK